MPGLCLRLFYGAKLDLHKMCQKSSIFTQQNSNIASKEDFYGMEGC